MLVSLRTRRRSHYGAHCCALTTAILLLLSIFLLYIRLTSDRHATFRKDGTSVVDDPFSFEDPLLQDSDPLFRAASSEDRIDELDVVDDDSKVSNEEEILRGLDSEGEDNDPSATISSSSGYYFDHVSHVIRHAFDRRSIDEVDRWDDYDKVFQAGLTFNEDRSKVAFGSDDVPVDEEVRKKMIKVNGIEDVLMLKLGSHVSPLREGWGPWFDAKSDFLRKDKMFKSNLETLNPLNNLLLQDPDGVGVTGLTRGDKLVQKGLLLEMKKPSFVAKKPLGLSDVEIVENKAEHSAGDHTSVDHTNLSRDVLMGQDLRLGQGGRVAQAKRRHLDGGASDDKQTKKSGGEDEYTGTSTPFANGQRWGHFPGLLPHLSFSNFMDSFFRKSNCSTRVFMVWNSPPWMYTVRHQRGLESLLFHHPDACVVVFSETIELDFFKEFVKDSFKVAVAMPNLEEILENTPTIIFASVWHEWRKTRFYATHYSELVRLAALYKYGGIYLDSDMVVLKPISSFINSVGMEEESPASPLNGAVMAFSKHSSFINLCMSEYYSAYDDTLLRWNGAELLTRVAANLSRKANGATQQQELKVLPASTFFPISSREIQRYFSSPLIDSEKTHQDTLFRKILNESSTFHLWNSVTSALVPEPDSLVARILNHFCTRCSDVL